MIIRCFKRKRAHFDAPGSLWTRLLWVLKRRGARAAASVLTPPPEPQLAPHTKRAKQHKRSGTLDDPLRRRRGTRRRTTQAAPRRRRVRGKMDPARLGPDHDPSKKGEHLEDPMMVTMDASRAPRRRRNSAGHVRWRAVAGEAIGGGLRGQGRRRRVATANSRDIFVV